MFYALAEHNDKMSERVNLFVALAPVVMLTHAHDGFIGDVSKNQDVIRTTLKTLGTYELLGKHWNSAARHLCNYLFFVCDGASYWYMTAQTAYNDHYRVNISRSKFPMGTSVKQLIHFGQLIKDKSFQKYDFGTPQKNWEAYHSETPPVINLDNI